jgi:hypothetical protein
MVTYRNRNWLLRSSNIEINKKNSDITTYDKLMFNLGEVNPDIKVIKLTEEHSFLIECDNDEKYVHLLGSLIDYI